MSRRYSKKEAAEILSVSTRTLEKWMKDGDITFTREPQTSKWKGSARVWFTADDLGITAQPAKPAPAVLPQPVVKEEPVEANFVTEYLAGRATDSIGNKITGKNERFPLEESASLIGPASAYPIPRPPVFNERYQIGKPTPMLGTDGRPVEHAGSDNHPLNRNNRSTARPEQPNQTRQEFLNAIFRDIRRGYSR